MSAERRVIPAPPATVRLHLVPPAPVTPAPSPKLCLNCDAPIGGKFCQSCGQAAKTSKLTFAEWIHEVSHATLHFEHALPHTLKGILTAPGPTIRAYLDGRRIRTYSPVGLLLLVAGLLALATVTLHLEPAPKDADDFIPKCLEYATHYQAWLILLVVPLDALTPYLLFRRTMKRGYAEQIAAATMIASGRAMIGLLAVPLLFLVRYTHARSSVEWVRDFAAFGYTLWAYATLQTEGTRLRRGLRALASVVGTWFFYGLAFSIVTTGLIVSYALSVFVLQHFGFHFTEISLFR